jgi:ADP-ribose pyrophosphatase YjhB (NUDIX family)
VASWHPPSPVPDGQPHGACGFCVTDAGEIVLISTDNVLWDFPAGRPQAGEDWEETLHREMLEEACAVVRSARLIGFSCGRKWEAEVAGPVLVRSIWLAQVDLLEWDPQFEIRYRRLAPPTQAVGLVLPEFEPLWTRAFFEAGIVRTDPEQGQN